MSRYADEGTVAHTVLESCLFSIYEFDLKASPYDYVGKQIEVRDGPHSKWSPSGAKRWLDAGCYGSVDMQRKLPEKSGDEVRYIEFTAEYANAVQETLDFVAEVVNKLRGETGEDPRVITERRTTMQPLIDTDEHDGTCDITILTSRRIYVIDFKGGAGVAVKADDPQLDLYLLEALIAALMEGVPPGTPMTPEAFFQSVGSRFDRLDVAIAQPRCYDLTPRIRPRAIENPAQWARDTYARVMAARKGMEEEPDRLSASEDGCRFCSARGGCKEYIEAAVRKAGALPPDDSLPWNTMGVMEMARAFAEKDPRFISPEQLRGILDAKGMLEGALTAAEGWALDMLKEGSAPPAITLAYKMGRGKSNRKYAQDEEETFKGLKRIKVEVDGKKRGLGKKDLYKQILLSVAQVETLLKSFGIGPKDARWDAFNELVTKPEGKLAIVPIDDPRPAVGPQGSPSLEETVANGPIIDAPDWETTGEPLTARGSHD